MYFNIIKIYHHIKHRTIIYFTINKPELLVPALVIASGLWKWENDMLYFKNISIKELKKQTSNTIASLASTLLWLEETTFLPHLTHTEQVWMDQ